MNVTPANQAGYVAGYQGELMAMPDNLDAAHWGDWSRGYFRGQRDARAGVAMTVATPGLKWFERFADRPKPVKRGRGRPRKRGVAVDVADVLSSRRMVVFLQNERTRLVAIAGTYDPGQYLIMREQKEGNIHLAIIRVIYGDRGAVRAAYSHLLRPDGWYAFHSSMLEIGEPAARPDMLDERWRLKY